MKKVAVILPAYNSEKTIEKTIQSVLEQTYDDYELIIINDHSTDRTEAISDQYVEKYPDKIRYYDNEQGKKGVSSARNFGLEKADSQYIMFVDSDDMYDKKMLEIMLNEIEKNQREWVICGYQKITLKNGNKRDFVVESVDATTIDEIKNTIEVLQKNRLFNGTTCKIYQKEIIEQYHIRFDEKSSIGEDYKFNITYVKHITSMKVISQYLYYYYISENGLSLTYTDDRLKIKLNNIKYQKEYYQEFHLNTNYIDQLYLFTFLSGIAMITEKNTKKEAVQKLKEQIQDKDIRNEIIQIRSKNISIKMRLLCRLALIKNAKIMRLLGCFANQAKKIYKKAKIE